MQNFSGTGYLGLQHNPEWLALVQQKMSDYGSNQPISRLNHHKHFHILSQAETYIANLFASEACALFSSGFLAGTAVTRLFAKKACLDQGWLWIPDNHHPCLEPPPGWRPMTLPLNFSATSPPGSLRSCIAFGQTMDPLKARKDPSTSHPIYQQAGWQVLDCSHSVGIWSHQHLATPRTIFLGSLGKAFAFPAGFVAGPKHLIEELKKSGAFCASAPPSLAFTSAFLEFTTQHQKLLSRLEERIALANHEWPLPTNGDLNCPVYNLGQCEPALDVSLKNRGFQLSLLRYPTPQSDLLLRMVLMADQDPKEIKNLISHLKARNVSPVATANADCPAKAFLSPATNG